MYSEDSGRSDRAIRLVARALYFELAVLHTLLVYRRAALAAMRCLGTCKPASCYQRSADGLIHRTAIGQALMASDSKRTIIDTLKCSQHVARRHLRHFTK